MSEKDIKILIEIAEKRIREGVTAEEALADFVSAGIMEWKLYCPISGTTGH